MPYYTENKKLGALTQVTLLSDSDNVLVEQSGTAKRTTILDFVKKVFTIGTTATTTTTSDSAVIIRADGSTAKASLNSLVPTNSVTNVMLVGNITDAKLDPIFTSGKVLDTATTANDGQTSATSAVYLGTTGNDKIVKRNGSGNFSANVITAAVVGNATSATNIASGTANDILYQSAANTTAKLSSDSATSGKYLRSNGASQAPSWESFASTLTVADHITGGTTGAVLYQSSGSVTAKLAPGAAGTLLTSTGTSNIPGWVATATTSAVAGSIVKRDEYGSFTGASITATTGFWGPVTGNCTGSSGSCTGNAATASSATKLTTARNITLSGDVTGTASFDGQTNASIDCTVVDDSHNHSALTAATNASTPSTIVKRGAGGEIAVGAITATSFIGNATGSSGSCTGNAATATKLSANKNIALTGNVTGDVSTDFTGDVSIAATLHAIAVSGQTEKTSLAATDMLLLYDASANTLKKLSGATLSNLSPVGGVIMWTSATVPAGWLWCNGAAIARTGTYAALYAVIGTTFGAGNGSTTFNIPNTAGRFVRGVGSDLSNASNGAILGVYQAHALQDHKHSVQLGPNGTNQIRVNANYAESGATALTSGVDTSTAQTTNETRPANLGLAFIIKY